MWNCMENLISAYRCWTEGLRDVFVCNRSNHCSDTCWGGRGKSLEWINAQHKHMWLEIKTDPKLQLNIFLHYSNIPCNFCSLKFFLFRKKRKRKAVSESWEEKLRDRMNLTQRAATAKTSFKAETCWAATKMSVGYRRFTLEFSFSYLNPQLVFFLRTPFYP